MPEQKSLNTDVDKREKYLKRRGKYYQKNKKEIRRKRKEYYLTDKVADRARTSKYYRANKDRLRERDLKRLYGITLSDYHNLYEKQDGVCRICKSDNNGKTLDVDHDHKTKRVRGLLCRSCNLLIGHAKEDPLRLFLALEYLEEQAARGKVEI